LAQTCQQHGQDTFIHQVSCRLQSLMTLWGMPGIQAEDFQT
jgi:hypothetical protein